MPKVSCPSSDSGVSVETVVSDAVQRIATQGTVKAIARDAEISETRAKQLRAGDTLPGIGPVIRLARKHAALRDLLVQLMHSECGEGDKSPAQILAEIARLVRG